MLASRQQLVLFHCVVGLALLTSRPSVAQDAAGAPPIKLLPSDAPGLAPGAATIGARHANAAAAGGAAVIPQCLTLAPGESVIPGKTYAVADDCVLVVEFPSSVEGAAVESIKVLISADDAVDDKDPKLKEVKPAAPGPAPSTIKFTEFTAVVRDSEYLLIELRVAGFGSPALFRFQVRRGKPYWMKLSIGAALGLQRVDGNTIIRPSPFLYSALAWAYGTTWQNYALPRSVGVLINPGFVAAPSDAKDLKPLLNIGLGTTLLDHYLLVGVTYDFGAEAPVIVFGLNKPLFVQ